MAKLPGDTYKWLIIIEIMAAIIAVGLAGWSDGIYEWLGAVGIIAVIIVIGLASWAVIALLNRRA